MHRKWTLWVCVLFLITSACASADKPVRTLQTGEALLETESGLLTRFHSILYYPSEISLHFPGFIVGIEKSPVDVITENEDADILTTTVPGAGGDEIEDAEGFRKRLVDSKVMFISHIVENFGLPAGKNNCAHFNSYHRKANGAPSPIRFCKPEQEEEIPVSHAFRKSWKALDILKEQIDQRLRDGAFTHILVVTMGWNTDQEEAVRNFNSIYKNIQLASNGRFHPLFIGVTWPSMWESQWFNPLYIGGSYPVKSTDGDEVGFSWLGALLHKTLRELDPKKPIVVVGHSFGARATSMATCVGPGISPDGQLLPRNKIDLLINLQGAYSINRFFEDRGAEMLYSGDCANAGKVALTASVHDKAVNIGVWAPFAGRKDTFEKFCKDKPRKNFTCIEVDPDGNLPLKANDPNPVLYINADQLIRYNAYKTGGGAHSDIYRRKTGTLMWNLIDTYAPSR